jgi:DNA-binding transcriptional regulator/RsmH inhibitor MraZ
MPQGNFDPAPPLAVNEIPLGRYSGKLDDKGRLKMPVRFQEFIQGLPGDKGLFITSLDRRTGVIYPVPVWRENLKRFKEYRNDPASVSVVQFNANDLGTEEKMDVQGRVFLNSDLRAALGLEDKATLHMQARNGHIELITEAVYQERRVRAQREAEAATEKLLGDGFE